MALKVYLIQRVDPRRLERFNVGLFATDDAFLLRRFLSDSQWIERFGPEGRLCKGGSFSNWMAWRRWLERLPLAQLDDPQMPAISTYQIIFGSERLFGGAKTSLDKYALDKFEEMVL